MRFTPLLALACAAHLSGAQAASVEQEQLIDVMMRTGAAESLCRTMAVDEGRLRGAMARLGMSDDDVSALGPNRAFIEDVVVAISREISLDRDGFCRSAWTRFGPGSAQRYLVAP